MALRKWLILTHRYLGIGLSLLFVVWFASGIVMIYARGMPGLTPELRLERLEAIDLDAVRVSPAEAAERAGQAGRGDQVTLRSVLGRPAYRFTGAGATAIIFADTGERLDSLGAERARAVASRFMGVPEERVRPLEVLNRADQWTIAERRQVPLYRFAVDDAAGTELYVAEQTAEVVVLTTRRSRLVAWVGAIPHWLYFAPLRLNNTLWRQVVLWTSGLGVLLALGGIVLGLVQLRAPRRREGRGGGWRLPYAGLLRWHHVTGLVFGVFALTWVFSGMLSMEPFFWASGGGPDPAVRAVLGTAPRDLSDFRTVDASLRAALGSVGAIKEVELVRLQGAPHYRVRTAGAADMDASAASAAVASGASPGTYAARGGMYGAEVGAGRTAYVDARTFEPRAAPFEADSLVARVRRAVPAVPILEARLLPAYDAYYYSRDGLPLPVLLVKLADAPGNWLYIDPWTGGLVRSVNRLQRVQRWAYNGLHSLDFGFWYGRRPLWDLGVIALSLGGLTLSVIGLALAVRRLRRAKRRPAR